MKMTWFHYLPWAGSPIIYRADRLAGKKEEIIRLEKDLRRLREEMKRDTAALQAIVDEEWNEEEQEEARERMLEEDIQPRRMAKSASLTEAITESISKS